MATKNLTIRLSDQLIEASKEYAKKQGRSLNEVIREYLERNVKQEDEYNWVDELIQVSKVNAKEVAYKFNRDEANER